MRLTRLELLGYKSFANKTEFAFSEGITAIIGPNGSGKSNIADALRWVLGEQSQSVLRAKRTEDLIFAGAEGRARRGMAEVVVTLDNTDITLPIDFTEVTITRRAYRSGESEYLLNGVQTRLRNVLELLTHSDLSRSTYAVIGQGLVDQALALRPEERRQLIDEAAGIRPYQTKRESTLARLDETETNLRRVHDILAEINPRLQRLQRHAERADEHARLSTMLREKLTVWHGYQWHHSQEQYSLAQQKRTDLACELTRIHDESVAHRAGLAATQAESDRHQAEITNWRRNASELRRQLEETRRSLAVSHERLNLSTQQRDEYLVEINNLTEQRTTAQTELATEEATLARMVNDQAEYVTRAESCRHNLADLETRQRATREALVVAQQCALDLAVHLADRRNRLTHFSERSTVLTREVKDLETTITRLQTTIETARVKAGQLQAAADATATQVSRVTTEVKARRAELKIRTGQETEFVHALRKAEQALQSTLSRRELLDGLRRGIADPASVTELMAKQWPGWHAVGRVSELIQVPGELDRAVEAALGSWLHAWVVASWDDAERAHALLCQAGKGRMSFISLDALRSALPANQLVYPLVERVGCDIQFRPLVDALLGDVTLTEDLTTARALWATGEPRCRYVTMTGEVLEPSGGITGGQADRSSILAREREWRILPGEIEVAISERDRLAAELNIANEYRRKLDTDLAALEQSVNRHQTNQRQQQIAADKAWRLVKERERELAWQRNLQVKRRSELDTITRQMEQVTAELTELELSQATTKAEVDIQQAEANQQVDNGVIQAAAEAQAALVTFQREIVMRQAHLKSLRETMNRLNQQFNARQLQVIHLDQELANLETYLDACRSEEKTLREEMAGFEEQIHQAEDILNGLKQHAREMEAKASQLRDRLLATESAHIQATNDVRRWEEQLARLRSEIQTDLDLVIRDQEEYSLQLSLELSNEGPSLPDVVVLPEGLEQQIRELKRRIRTLGPVDPDLLVEYETTRERSIFLVGQSEDLRKAADNLHQIVSELDRLMQQRFNETFEQVARLFATNFTELFGGGSAQLTPVERSRVTSDGNKKKPGEEGVEIFVRPPNKRLQPLSLLSGGERALTAVALIFALLEVSRTPFCLLDEVDAMLDEANVGRFRQVLERLAQQTQVIVISHNHSTIQAADTLYGLSMDDHGVSQVMSLKLNGLDPV